MTDTNEQLTELLSIVKSIDTRLLFLHQDSEELKEQIQVISDMVAHLMTNGSNNSGATPVVDKSARLEEFRKETARW
jgi:hypothetical protein